MPGDRVGLVGSNGAGKSTLLKCLTGVRPVDAGRMVVAHKVELGYLEQASTVFHASSAASKPRPGVESGGCGRNTVLYTVIVVIGSGTKRRQALCNI